MIRVAAYEGDEKEWDAFAAAQPGFTHFHRYGWRGVMERSFRHECLYLAAWDDAGALRGVLPLVRVKSLLFGHYLVSMPFLNYGGPLGDAEAVRALIDHAVELARGQGVKLLELRSRVELPTSLPASHRKITVVLDLPSGNPDLLFKSFEAKLRSQVRRPGKEGVEIRFGADQVAPFFNVFAQHMRDLGTPTQSRRFFDEIAATFGDSVWFACAWLGDQAIACGCGFVWGREIEMTWASSLIAFKRVSPNMGLYWAFMERAVRDGFTLFNFGRCTPDSGTHAFKRQWGSRDEPLWWHGWSAAAGATTPSPHDGAYAWGPRLWKRLPVSLATRLGPHIVRNIP